MPLIRRVHTHITCSRAAGNANKGGSDDTKTSEALTLGKGKISSSTRGSLLRVTKHIGGYTKLKSVK